MLAGTGRLKAAGKRATGTRAPLLRLGAQTPVGRRTKVKRGKGRKKRFSTVTSEDTMEPTENLEKQTGYSESDVE